MTTTVSELYSVRKFAECGAELPELDDDERLVDVDDADGGADDG